MPKKNFKIGFILDDTLDTPDGVQQYVMTVGAWLSKQGHEVHYLVGESKREDIQNVHSMAKNIKVRFNKNRLSIPLPTNKKLIAKKLKQLDLDIIHVQMPYSPLFAGRVISAVEPKTKIIGTFHIVPANWLHTAGAKSLEIINRHTISQFDEVISVSTAAARFARLTFGIETTIIPNAVNLKIMKHKPIQNPNPKIVFLGRLVERKGCQYLLKSLVKLQNQYHGKYTVVIAGKGPLKKSLEKYAKSNKIKNIEFIGFVDEKEKPALLASADIAVFPSTGGESFGIVLIEAMAAGARVVLGGDNVGYRGVLSDHPDLLINPRDALGFANRLQYFLEHKKIRKTASEWSKANIGQYDVEVVGKKILNVYKKVSSWQNY
jgi:phosphatidyl-myo-inositol alpha-mannosyltransferase